MNKIIMSEDEKKLLRFLQTSASVEHFKEISKNRRDAAAESLKRKELIAAHFSEEDGLFSAWILPAGESYLEANPELENPVSEEIELLTKRNLELQNKEMEYRARIKEQEDIIRYFQLWKILMAVIGGLGWLLLAIKFFK